MEMEEVYQGKYADRVSIERMVVRMARRKSSKRSMYRYVVAIQRFMDYLGVDDPDVALEKVKKEGDLEELLNGFLDQLWREGLTSSTISGNFYGVKRWLTTNGVKADWSEVEMVKVEAEESFRIPTLEELRVIFNNAYLRERVVLAICVSSGIRIGNGRFGQNLLALNLGEIDLDQEIPMIKVPPWKAKGRRGYVTFMSPEAKTLLLKYLEARRNMGETLTDESPVITSSRRGELGNFIDHRGIWVAWTKALKRSGLYKKSTRILDNGKEVEGSRVVLSIHSLRKFFKTTCVMNGVLDNLVERLMGQRGKYLDTSYFHPSIQSMLKAYRKVIPKLTISETEELKHAFDQRITQEIGKVKEELKRKDEEMRKRDEEIAKLKEDVKRKDMEREKRLREMEEIIKNLSIALTNNNH